MKKKKRKRKKKRKKEKQYLIEKGKGKNNDKEGKQDNDENSSSTVSIDGKITIGVQTGSFFGLGGKFGFFANLYSITLFGYDSRTKKILYPGSQKYKYTQMNQSVSGGYLIGGEFSHTFDGGIEHGGYTNSKTIKSFSFSGKTGILGLSAVSRRNGVDYYLNIPIRVGLILGFEGNIKIKLK